MFHHTSRPGSQWVVVEVTNVIFYLFKMTSHPIGCGDELPHHLVQNRGVRAIRALQKDPFKDVSTGTTCASSAVWLCIRKTIQVKFLKNDKIFIQKHCNHFDVCPSNFKEVLLDETI